MKFYVNGREVRQTVVQGMIESLFECIDAVKNNGNEKYQSEQIAKIKSNWPNYRKFLIPPAENALRGIESEFDLRFHSGIIEIKSGSQTIFLHTKGGIVQRVEL